MKVTNIKSIIKAFPIILFLLSHNLSNCQITYKPESDIILTNPDSETGKNDVFHVYNTEYNPQTRELYFFNRLSTANTGFYVYDLDAEQVVMFVQTEKAIGDLAYNSEQGHVLVSEFFYNDDNTAIIQVFDANNNYTPLPEPISFDNSNFPSDIFCAPNGKIYVSINMLVDDLDPQIKILNSSDYNDVIASLQTGFVEDPEYAYSTVSNYCYNPYDETVYVSLSRNGNYYSPYQVSAISTFFQFYDANFSPMEEVTDRVIGITNDNEIHEDNTIIINRPGEIICAVPFNDPGLDYKGKLFINADQVYSYDCNTKSLNGGFIFDVFDIDYNAKEDCLYAYQYSFINQPDSTPNDQEIVIHKIDENGDGQVVELWRSQGMASSINYNEYDNILYIHYISDDEIMGESPMKIIRIDTEDYSTLPEIPTTNTCLFPEVVPVTNYPFFDPYKNKAYFPNGMHSSVGVIEFTAKEALKLDFTGVDKKIDYISIPRMVSNETANWDDQENTNLVFDRNRFGTPYSNLELLYRNLQTSYDPDYIVTWDEDVLWKYIPVEPTDNKNIYSYRGYTLNLNTDAEIDNYVYMYGNIKNPATSFPLYPQQNNWVGYFLTEEQDIFDALGTETLGLLDYIDHQDFCCEKKIAPDPYDGPTHGGAIQFETYFWVCDKHQTNIKYGDMVKLHSVSLTGEDNDLIQWQNSGNTTREKLRPDVEYFTYSETSSSTAITIVLNYESNPLEIGAFVNNECVGAVALMPEDTVVILRAYLDGVSPDSIVFQDWFGTKSSEKGIIKDYRVFNKSTGFYENRILKSNINSHRVRISFKEGDDEEGFDIVENSIDIWPNPARDKLNYSFYSNVDGKLNISLFDINGKLVSILIDKNYQKGLVSGVIDLNGFSGYSVKPGIYFVKVKMGDSITTKKLVIQ